MTSHVENPPKVFRTISEVANSLGVQQHVLRFWESKFVQISPMKRGGGRRYYRPEDVEIIEAIRKLLHEDGYTIKGAQKHLKEYGVDHILKAVDEEIEGKLKGQSRDIETSSPESSGSAHIPKSSVQNSLSQNTLAQNVARSESDARHMASLKEIKTRLENIRTRLKDGKS